MDLYEKVKMEIVVFETVDVITGSNTEFPDLPDD